MEVKEQDAFESWNDACWLVYCVWFWKTFAYAFKQSEMAVLDSDPYLAWLLIQLGIYWKRRSEEGRGMQVCLQRLLTMPMLYVLPYDVGKRPDQFCLSCWIFFNLYFHFYFHFLHAYFGTDVGKCLSRAWQPRTAASFLIQLSPEFRECCDGTALTYQGLWWLCLWLSQSRIKGSFVTRIWGLWGSYCLVKDRLSLRVKSSTLPGRESRNRYEFVNVHLADL